MDRQRSAVLTETGIGEGPVAKSDVGVIDNLPGNTAPLEVPELAAAVH
jgi:hypothetical protein